MHSTEAPSGQTYHHNGDFSGVVMADIPVRHQTRYPEKDHTRASCVIENEFTTHPYVEVEIPFEDVKYLVLAYLRSKAVSFLEQADDETLEKFFSGPQGW